ncbi:MAG: hypothetical protein ACFB16_13235 [Phormidesmis sp.]
MKRAAISSQGVSVAEERRGAGGFLGGFLDFFFLADLLGGGGEPGRCELGRAGGVGRDPFINSVRSRFPLLKCGVEYGLKHDL